MAIKSIYDLVIDNSTSGITNNLNSGIVKFTTQSSSDVLLSTNNIKEGSNFYFTNARVSANSDVIKGVAGYNIGGINGLSKISGSVGLGGTLNQNTTVNTSTFNFLFKDVNTKTIEDFKNRSLNDTSGLVSVDWRGRTLEDSTQKKSIDWQNRVLDDSTNTNSVNWGTRKLYSTSGVSIIDWKTGKLEGFYTPTGKWDLTTKKYVDDQIGTIAESTTAGNGLTMVGQKVTLGGTLTQNTNLNLSTFNLLVKDVNNKNVVDFKNRSLYNTSGSTAIDWRGGYLYDPSHNISMRWTNRIALDALQGQSIDWNNRFLTNNNANAVDWFNDILNDNNGFISLDWNNKILNDNLQILSFDWANRTLYDTTGTQISLDWTNRKLYSTSGVTLVDWQSGKLEGFYTPTGKWDLTNKKYVDAQVAASAKAINGLSVISGSVGLGGTLIQNTTISQGVFSLLVKDANTKTIADFKQLNLNDTTGKVSIDWQGRNLYDNTSKISVDYLNRRNKDGSSVTSIDWGSRQMFDTTSVTSINWNTRGLLDNGGNLKVDWQNSDLYTSTGNRTVRWGVTLLKDNTVSNVNSLDWQARKLYSTSGVTLVDWQSGKLEGFYTPTGKWDLTNKKYVDAQIASIAESTTAGNGLTMVGQKVTLGGSLTQNTNLNLSTFNFLVKDSTLKVVEDFKNRSLNDTKGLVSVDWRGRNLEDSTQLLSLGWDQRRLYGTNETLIVDWANQQAYDNVGNLSIDWNSRYLNDASSILSLNWINRTLDDSTGNISLNWTNRKLYSTSGVTLVDWQSGKLEGFYTPTGNWDLVNKTYVDSKNSILFEQLVTQTQIGDGVNASTGLSLLSSSAGNLGSTTIGANTLKVGDIVQFNARGFLNVTTAGTFTFNVKLGSTTIASQSSVIISNPKTNNLINMDFHFIVRSIGATGKVMGDGYLLVSGGGVSSPTMVEFVMTTASTINTTSAQAFDFNVSWLSGFTGNLNITSAYIRKEKI